MSDVATSVIAKQSTIPQNGLTVKGLSEFVAQLKYCGIALVADKIFNEFWLKWDQKSF